MSEAARGRQAADATYADDVRHPSWGEAAAAARGALVPAATEGPDPEPLDAEPLEVEPLAGDDAAGNLRRYARWQWNDFWRTRGLWIAGFALLVTFAVWYRYDPAAMRADFQNRTYYNPNGYMARLNPTFGVWLGRLLVGTLSVFAVLAGVVSTFGVVSHERERGLQRFLFAKPVGPTRYYLQKLGIAAAGFFVVMGVVAAVAAFAFGAPLPVAALAIGAACTFAVVGGLTFLLSTLTRFDGAAALALLVTAMPVTVVAWSRSAWAPLAQLARLVLPPFEALSLLGGATGQYVVSYPVAVAWSLAYGAACVAAGVWVLRRRSITT